LNKKEILRLQRNYSPYARALTHCLVYFLAQEHKDKFVEIILKVKNGSTSYNAINGIYPGGFAQFEKDFMTFYWN
jgi:hypothetical protein